jgi:hypothetical protein
MDFGRTQKEKKELGGAKEMNRSIIKVILYL